MDVTQPSPGTALPARAADTSPERPWPVRYLSLKVGEYIDRMPVTWVEGQVVQLNRRPGARTAYLTLRDTDADMSLSCSVRVLALDAMPTPLTQGSRVVIQTKAEYWAGRGSLTFDVRQIRPVGVGELLARIEYLKQNLAAEGLFDARRKRSLPFLPRRIGLICGRASAAERDVVENVRRRWPSARFEIRQVAVQGVGAVEEVTAALQELDTHPEVDVVVITRGGGSVEDLLPFNNEALVRAVSAARTPVVSAIGHEVDTPLLDLVADLRASTPTDAARAVVPDAVEQTRTIADLRARARTAQARRIDTGRRAIASLVDRPVMADRVAVLDRHRERLEHLTARLRHLRAVRLDRERDRTVHLLAQVRLLAPRSTLDRGYAIVQHPDGTIVRSREQVSPGELLRVRVGDGDFTVRVVGADG